MGTGKILALSVLALALVVVLSAIWSFGLHDLLHPWLESLPLPAAGHSVLETGTLAALALAVPTALAVHYRRVHGRRDAALRESEERYRSLVELSPSAIVVHKRGTIVYANPAAAELLAAPEPDDLVGIGMLCLVHPDDQPFAGQRLRSLWAGAPRLPATEMRLVRLDGEEVAASVSSGHTNFRGEAAQQSVIRDVTERRRTESMLRTVAEGVSGSVGESFFHQLVEYLAAALGARHAFVGELRRTPATKVRTLAVCSDGRQAANFQYDIAGTPCASVAEGQSCIFDRGVRDKFPQDGLLVRLQAESYVGTPLLDSDGQPMGVLAVVDTRPLPNDSEAIALLRIFAVRAAVELERSRAEEALRAGEERFRSLARSASDGIISADQDGRILFWNDAAERIFGYPEPEMLGRFVSHLMPERYRDRHEEGIRRLAEGGEEHLLGRTIEMEGLRKDGREFPVELSLSSWSARGQRYFTAVVRDVSERRRIEQELRKLSNAVQQSPVTVMITDTDGSIEYVNPQFTVSSGYAPEEAIGRDPSMLKGGYKTPGSYKAMWRYLKEGRVWRGEFLNRRKDGRLYWESASISPIRDPQGTITHYLAVKEDITERKRHEQELELSRARLANAQRLAHLGDWNWTVASDRLGWSEEIYRIFGLTHAEFDGTYGAFLERVHPDDRAKVDAAVRKALDDGEDYTLDHRIVRPDGTVRYVNEQAEVEFDEADRPLTMTGTVLDVTERKEYEDALVRAKEEAEFASRAKTEFLANMSHELRTPLNSIIGFSDILVSEAFGAMEVPEYREYVRDINDSGKHLLDLINDLLDIARIETGELRLYERNVDVAQVARACERLVKERAGQGEIALDLDLAPELPALYADERKLKQILLNLMSNAIKFTDRGGRVTLRVDSDDIGGLRFTVSDTGIGISAEDIPVALSTFGQADSSLARRYEGAGLGLPLSKKLTELHGGSLTLESEPGVGTTVTVHMPPDRSVVRD